MHSPIRSLLITAGLLSLSSGEAGAAIIATYPVGTLLENIAVSPSGDLYATEAPYSGPGSVFRVSPSGSSQLFGQTPDYAAGIAFDTDGALIIASGTSLYRFAPDGTRSLAAQVIGARFLNGITAFGPHQFLAADDTANVLWLVNLATGASTLWSSDPLLIPGPEFAPFSPNGVKVFQGSVYASNTGSGTIVRIPILPNGSAGTGSVYLNSGPNDDFAFGADGTLFIATEGGEIIRAAPDGTRTSLSTGTFGDAAVAFGRTAADNRSIYVVNNGGAYIDLPGGPEAANIVRLDVGVSGVAPETQVVPEPSSLALSFAGGAVLWLVLLNKRRCLKSTTAHLP